MHAAEGALVLVALLLAFAFAVGGYLVGREHGKRTAAAATTVQTSTGGGDGCTGDAKAGAEVFASAGCGGCHTLAAAGVDRHRRPRRSTAKNLVRGARHRARHERHGARCRRSAISSSEQQIADVAAYVHESSQK